MPPSPVYFYFMVTSSLSFIISIVFQTVIHKLYQHIFNTGDVIVEIEGEDVDRKNHSLLVDTIKNSKQELKWVFHFISLMLWILARNWNDICINRKISNVISFVYFWLMIENLKLRQVNPKQYFVVVVVVIVVVFVVVAVHLLLSYSFSLPMLTLKMAVCENSLTTLMCLINLAPYYQDPLLISTRKFQACN